jgi:hypothetical protein
VARGFQSALSGSRFYQAPGFAGAKSDFLDAMLFYAYILFDSRGQVVKREQEIKSKKNREYIWGLVETSPAL